MRAARNLFDLAQRPPRPGWQIAINMSLKGAIMKYLVVYDTSYGNTAKIAGAIKASLGADAEAREIETLQPGDLANVDLLVVGSPTQGGRPTQSMDAWLRKLPTARKGSPVAIFDTRLSAGDVAVGLRLLMNVIGYAAPRITKALVAKGYTPVGEPQGFIVTGKEGPLAGGEIDRARAWGEKLARQFAKVSTVPA
jgi:flavodoxin I